MMPVIADLYEPIAAELEKVCRRFDDELFSELPVVNEMCTHVRQYRGKLLRPALLMLAGKACGDLTDDHAPVRRDVFFQPNSHLLIFFRGFRAHSVQEFSATVS